MPEVASVPWNVNANGWFHQASWSGGRAGTNPVTVGGVASIRITAVNAVLRPFRSLTSHMTGAPAVSCDKVWIVQLPASGCAPSSQAQAILTGPVCHAKQSVGVAGSG